MPPHGIVAFDLDGTLVRIWSAWSWIHRLLGTFEAAKPNADQYYAREISYIQWAELDVKLWHGVPLTRIQEAIDEGMVFIPNVKPLIETLHEHKIFTAIISSGLSIFADRAKELLGIDISKANKLVTDAEGRICGVEVHVAFDNKDKVLKNIAQEAQMALPNCVAIGDSRNDISMFQVAGFSIAFNPTHEEVAQAASIVIESEDALDLLPPLLQHFKLEPQ
ncbi:MAG: HAD-IB family phosphatase [Promethearchaeota archaeon]